MAAKFNASWKSPRLVAPFAAAGHDDQLLAPQPRPERDAHGVHELRGHDRRLRDDAAGRARPVRRHLPAVAIRVVPLAEDVQHRFAGSHPEDEVHRQVAVVGGEVIGSPFERHGSADLSRLLSGASNHEGGAALTVEDEHPLGEAPRKEHVVVHLLELRFRKQVVVALLAGAGLPGAFTRCHSTPRAPLRAPSVILPLGSRRLRDAYA
jgi:hypothetical protein